MATPDEFLATPIANQRKVCRSVIIASHLRGMTNSQIEQEYGFHHSTIERWVQRVSPEDLPRSGRPNKLTPSIEQQIESAMRERTGVGYRTCKKQLEANGININKNTIRKFVRSTDWGKTTRYIKNKTMLTSLNIESRINFGQHVQAFGYLDDTPDGKKLRENILFVDETTVRLHPPVNSRNAVYRTVNKDDVPCNYLPHRSQFLHVVCGINGLNKTELMFFSADTSINGELYASEVLPNWFSFLENESNFHSGVVRTFMHDGAPAHQHYMVKAMLNHFQHETGTEVFANPLWPGNSPDLNPIENAFPALHMGALEDPRPTNLAELKERTIEKWNELTSAELSKLNDSFKNRISKILSTNGHQTDY